jgi:HD-like signal output (HDOD) protein
MDDFRIWDTIQNAEHIGSSPSISLALYNEIRSEGCSIDTIVGLINKDPTITAQVLKVANSPFYFRGNKVATLHQAVTLLGLEVIEKIVFAIELIGKFGREHSYADFNYHIFWKNVIAVSRLAEEIANLNGSAEPELAYLSGLLGSIGILFMRQYYPALFQKVFIDCKQRRISFAQSASEIWFYDQKFLSYLIGLRWNLPEIIVFSFKDVLKSQDVRAFKIHNYVYLAESIIYMKEYAVWDWYYNIASVSLFHEYDMTIDKIDYFSDKIIGEVNKLSLELSF